MAGLLLCIVAIIIGVSYPETWEPESFSPFLALAALVLCTGVCRALGSLASIRMKKFMEIDGSRLRAAIEYARFRKVSWLAVLGLYAILVYLFDYPYLIRTLIRSETWLNLHSVPLIGGVEQILILLPFFLFAAANLAGLYSGDRLLRGSSWSARQFRAFYLRQFLVPAFPFLIFSAAYDGLVRIPGFEETIYVYPSLVTAAYAVFITVLFGFAPVLFRLLWKVERLPDGPLRRRVEQMAGESGIKYGEIFIWHTGGSNIANAMVTGIFSRVRYIFVTDALLARLPEEEVVAVLAHELGHARYGHMQIYLVLALSFITFVNSAEQQVSTLMTWAGEYFHFSIEFVLVLYALSLLIVFWGLIFGFTSRRFEQAADVFAAQKVSPAVFGSALGRIGFLSGGSRTMSSWRHFSIDRRVHFMEEAAAGGSMDRFRRSLRAAYAVVGVIFVLGLGSLAHQVYATASPQSRYERRFGYVWHKGKDFERALAIADRAIASDPDLADYRLYRAATLEKLGRLEEAEAAILEAIRLDPRKSDFYYQYGEILMKLDRLGDAKKAVLNAIRLEPDEKEYHRQLGRLMRKLRKGKKENGPLRGNGNPPAE
jgi:Zn-dependent protease with chaperone function